MNSAWFGAIDLNVLKAAERTFTPLYGFAAPPKSLGALFVSDFQKQSLMERWEVGLPS